VHFLTTDTAGRGEAETVDAASRYAWLVFAVTFGLLLSDYMSRQVLNAVFPQLKAEWALSDARLGALSGVVSLAVGLLALPLSLLADRWGRIRSLVLMAALWSIATLACALAQDYQQMLAARLMVGIGEAAYGSVGLAVLLTVFPTRMRATISGTFLAGGMIGSVLGISLGGFIAAHFGWRAAFAGMAVFGIVLTIFYPLVVKEGRVALAATNAAALSRRPRLRTLVSSRSVICAYLGSGVQLFISGALLAWLPSYLNRYYDMPIANAALVAATFVLTSAAGIEAVVGDRLLSHLVRHALDSVPVAARHPAADSHRARHVLRRRHGRPGGCDGGESHAGADSWHGVRYLVAREQSAGARARADRHGPARRCTRSVSSIAVGAARQPRSRRHLCDRESQLSP
jgi:MFS family permease